MPSPPPTRSPARLALLASPWAASLALHAIVAGWGLALVSSGPSRGTHPSDGASIAVAPMIDAPSKPVTIAQQPAPVQPRSSAADLTLPERALSQPSGAWNEVRVAIAPMDAPDTALTTLAAPLPTAPAPEMFGARGDAQAQRIVYVVDASGSMVAALPTIARELDRSLDLLSGSQWFQVVVFSGRGVESPPALGASLARATDQARRAAGEWLRNLEPDRRGDAVAALERALRLNPDVVFLVVKGGLGESIDQLHNARQRDAALTRLSRATRGSRASIKVIQFFDPDPSGLIEAIASNYSGGDTLRFISRKDLGIE